MGPFMKSEDNTSKMMFRVVIALIPIIIFSFYKNGIIPYIHQTTDLLGAFYPLLFISIAVLSTLIFETFYQLLFNKDKNLKKILGDSYAYMPGLFLGLILPINTPLSIVVIGGFCASIIGKMLFGGFGKNIFNPALIGRLMIISTYSLIIMNNGGYLNSYEVDTISSATPLSNVSLVTGIGTYEQLVAPYGSLWDFLIGTIPGCVGETSSLLCLAAFVYLTITKTIKWRIPVCYVSTVFLMTLGIALFNKTGIWYPIFEILSGGLLFGAVFMATDPVTSPITKSGQIIYGLLLGLLTVTLRYLTAYPEGVLTSILTMNMLVFIIDKLGVKIKFDKKKIIIPLVIIIFLIIAITLVIGDKKNVKIDSTDHNFEIISKEVANDKTTYIVTEQGYESKIKIQIVISNDRVTSIEILDQNDSFFSKVIDANYTEKLLQEQDNLSDCDTVSGATFSSTAVRKALINTLSDYRGE